MFHQEVITHHYAQSDKRQAVNLIAFLQPTNKQGTTLPVVIKITQQ